MPATSSIIFYPPSIKFGTALVILTASGILTDKAEKVFNFKETDYSIRYMEDSNTYTIEIVPKMIEDKFTFLFDNRLSIEDASSILARSLNTAEIINVDGNYYQVSLDTVNNVISIKAWGNYHGTTN